MQAHRSYLFAPGNHARKMEKVFGCGADHVILDLEDSVAVGEKAATREHARAALARPRACGAYVRVNAADTEFCYGDLCAVVGPGLDGIVLPKVETPVQLQTIDWLLGQLERAAGLEVGALDLIPIVETARGLAALHDIARSGARVRRLSIGAADLSADLNMEWTREEAEMTPARHALAVASRAAGLEPPLDTVFVHIREHDALRRSAERARDLGFQGKACIHPDQVPIVNETFTPSEARVARARAVVAAFEEAEARGSASIQLDGYFIDYPIVEKARRTLALHAAVRGRSDAG